MDELPRHTERDRRARASFVNVYLKNILYLYTYHMHIYIIIRKFLC